MAIEARAPPSQFVAKLRRLLGGGAGWKGLILQILFLASPRGRTISGQAISVCGDLKMLG